MGLNKVMLIGNLGTDPVAKERENGQKQCTFRMATNERFIKGNGEVGENTEWHRVVTYGKTADTCAKYLQKGRKVYVEGRSRTFTNEVEREEDGVTKVFVYRTSEVVAKHVEFLDKNGKPREDVEVEDSRE